MRAVAAGVLAVGLVLGGCSGDDSSADPTTTAGADVDETVPTFTGDPGSELCTLLAQLDLGTLAGEPASGKPLPEAFEAQIDLFLQMEEAAPPELEPDIELLGQGVFLLDQALYEVDYDFDRRGADVERAMNDPAFTTAADRIVGYRDQVCTG